MQQIHLWLVAAFLSGFGGSYLVDVAPDRTTAPLDSYLAEYERQSDAVPWRGGQDGHVWRRLDLGGGVEMIEYRVTAPGASADRSAPQGCVRKVLAGLRVDGGAAVGEHPPAGAC